MKKLFRVLLILALAVACSLSLFACGDGNDEVGTKGIKCKKIDGVYTIYDYVEDGISVLNLADCLEEGVTNVRIKKGAFSGNNTLTKIIVSDKITEIDKGAFENMNSLESLEVPFIGKTANSDAYYAESKKDVDKATDSARTIAHFFGDTEYGMGVPVTINYNENASTTCYMPLTFTEVIVNATSEYSIPMYAFNGAVNLTSVKLVGNIDAIGEYAFSGCKEIKSIEIPATVKTIYKGAFKDCAKLATLTVGEGATLVVKDEAFVGTKVARNALDNYVSQAINKDKVFGEEK